MSREEQAASALAGLKEELQQDPPQEGEEMKHEQAGAVSEGGSGKEDDIATETAASGSRSGALATDTAAVQQAAARAKRKYRKRKKEPVHRYPVPPRIVKVVNKPRTFVNHR